MLRELGPMCRKVGVPLVANDRADLAVLTGCDMVHVGQGDLPVKLARRIAPNLGIGVSTHNLEQLARALDERPTYVAFGPVFSTRSKSAPDPICGVALLGEAFAMARAARIPLVAIGGIDIDNGSLVAGHCDGAAVIAALLPAAPLPSTAVSLASIPPMPASKREAFAADVRGRAAALHALFGGMPVLKDDVMPGRPLPASG